VLQRGACPDCGAQMQYEEGCAKCNCGYSDCGWLLFERLCRRL